MADVLTLPSLHPPRGNGTGLQRAFTVWSTVALMLGGAATQQWQLVLIITGISAFGYATVAFLKRGHTRLAIILGLVAWSPLAVQTWHEMAFAIRWYPNFERPDGYGSPLVFIVNFAFEQIFFLPLSVMILLLLRHWWRSRRAGNVIPGAIS